MDGDGGNASALVSAADLKARHGPDKRGFFAPRQLTWDPAVTRWLTQSTALQAL